MKLHHSNFSAPLLQTFLFVFLNSLYLSLLAFYGEIDSDTLSGFMAGIN